MMRTRAERPESYDWDSDLKDPDSPHGDIQSLQRLRKMMRHRALRAEPKPVEHPCPRCKFPTYHEPLCAMCQRDDELALGRAAR